MNQEDLEYVQDIIKHDGFERTLLFCTDFPEIDDPEFHRLRQKFLNARYALLDYLDLEED